MIKKVTPYCIERSLVIILAVLAGVIVLWSWYKPLDYNGFSLGDWLINYQGGFVRRGLLGEILWQVYQWVPYPVRTFLTAFQTICFATFALLMYRIFQYQRWSLLPLLIPFACATFPLLEYRRDFLMLLFCYGVYNRFLHFLSTREKSSMALVQVLIVLSILIYEPIFFVMVPILIWLYLQYRWETGDQLWQGLWRTGLVFALPIATMGVVCLSSGSPAIADAIYASWDSLFSGSSGAIDFLKKTNADVMKYHLTMNFYYREGLVWIASLGALAFLFACSVFLTVQVPIVQHDQRKLGDNTHSRLLGGVMLFQLVMMLPMFTVLSCDYGRTIPYCMYTTFMLVHLMDRYQLRFSLPWLGSRVLDAGRTLRNRYPSLSNPWLYFSIVLLTPMRSHFCPHPLDNVIGRWIEWITINLL